MESCKIDLNEFKRNICRICLGDDVCLDWNMPLYEFYNTTYKDCYYKYSQLESHVSDPFPQMLCQNCASALHSTHALILKALESHKLLQSELSSNSHIKELGYGDIKFTPAEFETVLVEKVEEFIMDDHLKYDKNSDKEEIVASNVSANCDKQIRVEEFLKEPSNNSLKANASPTKTNRKCAPKVKREQAEEEEKSVECEIIKFNLMNGDDGNEVGENTKAGLNEKKRYKETKTPRMCSICSKILHNKYAVQRHEKTHIENRERKEICKVCGLKFYDKRNLYSHMRIHKENREKRHKCEFCSKAFYDKGGLNIHRRIHLGQMIPCSLCTKEFFRQVDLERHMNSHSATTINCDTKQRSRYFVRCKHCDKSILSTSFKSHTAAHLNEPLMKCLICDKEFFRRRSCVVHVKKIHDKSNDEYNDFISIYKNNRISHLFLEQKADIQVNIN